MREAAIADRNRGGHMNARSIVGLLLLSAASIPAFAGPGLPLPEPGVLELLAIGAVAGVAIAIRNRRKK
jgi:hypothetical protein